MKKYTSTVNTGRIHFRDSDSENFDIINALNIKDYGFDSVSYEMYDGGAHVLHLKHESDNIDDIMLASDLMPLMEAISISASNNTYAIIVYEEYENDVLIKSTTIIAFIFSGCDITMTTMDEHMSELIGEMDFVMSNEDYEYRKACADELDDDDFDLDD